MENDLNKRIYNRTLLLTVTLLMVTLIVIIIFYQFYIKGSSQTDKGREYDKYYVMITDNRKSSFMQAVHKGAFDTGQEESIYVDMLGDNLPSDYTLNDLFRIAISSQVDGIIVEADESEEMTQLINEAVDEGIPVVTLLNDNTKSNRCSYVGVGGYNIGREYGRQVIEIINEKRSAQERGDDYTLNVAVLVNSNNQTSGQNIIVSALQETVEQRLGNSSDTKINVMAVDNTNTFSVEESVRDIFMNQDIPDIIVALDELTTTCVYQAIVDYNVVGKVTILGYYNSDTIVNAINRGAVYSTIFIDTAQLGEYCVEALKEYNELGATSQYFTADIMLINKSNVSMYMTKEEENAE